MSENAALFSDELCSLGEGAFWHPLRKELFWFDINNSTLFGADASGQLVHRMALESPGSAAALIDFQNIAIAVKGQILALDLATRSFTPLHAFEADNPVTRSNDARVSPNGVWWLSTMGKNAEPEAGALYAFSHGSLKPVRSHITIPNSICFSPDGRLAYFTDTVKRVIERIEISPETALPIGEWEPFIDLRDAEGAPDGAVTDSAGNLWSAQYGGGQVVRYTPEGKRDRVVDVPAKNVTCPALGGPHMSTLYITTARQGLDAKALEKAPFSGAVFAIEVDVAGRPEVPLAL